MNKHMRRVLLGLGICLAWGSVALILWAVVELFHGRFIGFGLLSLALIAYGFGYIMEDKN